MRGLRSWNLLPFTCCGSCRICTFLPRTSRPLAPRSFCRSERDVRDLQVPPGAQVKPFNRFGGGERVTYQSFLGLVDWPTCKHADLWLIEHLCVGIAARCPCCVATRSRVKRSLRVIHVVFDLLPRCRLSGRLPTCRPWRSSASRNRIGPAPAQAQRSPPTPRSGSRPWHQSRSAMDHRRAGAS